MPPKTLPDLISREPAKPWAQGGKIPWHEPGFSARMLREHLLQEHDQASRRFEKIDAHVSWLHEFVLGGRASRILDLGCGPGLYSGRLARRGHRCVGIDFSPASIAHARAEAERDALSCEYHLRDLRGGDFGGGYDAVLLLFGEFNTFPPEDARALLARARRALAPEGTLVLEVHDEEFVRTRGEALPTWFTARQSVFSDTPHLCLRESAFDPALRASVERHLVVPLSGGAVASYLSSCQAYSHHEYVGLLQGAGFPQAVRHESLAGSAAPTEPGLFVWLARSEEAPREGAGRGR